MAGGQLISSTAPKPRAWMKKKNPSRRRVIRKAVKVAVNRQFKKKVLNVIRSQSESKQAWLTQTPIDFNSGINAAGDCLRVIPNISKGTNDNNRIGDQIRCQSVNIRAILQMLPQGLGQGDGVRKLAVRLMVVTPKGYNNWASASANATTWMQYLLKKGGTTTAFTGDISDLFAPGNTDAITFHYNKVHYFNQSTYGQATSSGLVEFSQANLVKFLNIKLRMRNRLVKYDDSIDSGLTPANLGYFVLCGYAFTDGGSPDVLSTRVRLQYDTIFNYEDN